ncbi:hypothetical protein ACLB2K_022970 [Fragaria x ananassa]
MWYTVPKPLIFLFVFTASLNSFSSSATPDILSYADHCASTVPESTPIRYASFDPSVLSHTGYYAGGGSGSGICSPRQGYQHNQEPSYPVEFDVWSVEETDVQDLFEVHGSLQFQRDTDHMGTLKNSLPQSPIRFALNGFWSSSSGKLCMAGSGAVPEYYLQYSSHCLSAKNCTTPLSGSAYFPSIVALRGIECLEDNRRLRVLVEFADQRKHWYEKNFNPNMTLVGEGSWDVNKTQLQVVACHFLDATNSFNNSHVGNCSTRLSLTFPGIWTIRDTRDAAGHIWSNKAVVESGDEPAGLKYEYTQIEKVTKLCPREKSTAPTDYKTKRGPYNISFIVFINVSNLSIVDVISAEGVYDDTEGSMCMVGCRNLGPINQQSTGDSVDCEILLKLQLPPATPERMISGYVKGSIESTRKKSDPLHFERLDLSSDDMFMAEADRSIHRMEVETTLVLISTGLAYVLGALQLFHVKKRPDMLPSISLLMLLILTLEYLKPLIYYFDAIFNYSTNHQGMFIGSDGWLQIDLAYLMAITVMTMLAFLLQFRLFQQTWSARSSKDTLKELWDAEKKAVSVYAIGILAAMALLMISSLEYPILGSSNYGAYAGLVLDGFLFPQILLNMVCKSKGKALSAGFYIGTTIIRILPHAYDLYRTGSSDLVLEEPYVFASPVAGFYSTTWDVILPMGALLFSMIIFLQQKFGGRCFLPQKLRELGDKKTFLDKEMLFVLQRLLLCVSSMNLQYVKLSAFS